MSKYEDLKAALQSSVSEMIRKDTMPDSQYQKLINIYPPYAAGVAYETGDRITYDGNLYEIIQAHTSQADWPPDSTASLYKLIVPDNVIDVWRQPQGAHDTYAKGDKVIYDNQIWISTANNNAWKPGVYGWELP